MIRRAFLALCAIGSLGAPLTATAFTGNELLGVCNDGNTNNIKFGLCLGFIKGVSEGFMIGERVFNPQPNQQRIPYCIPDSVTDGQIRDIVIVYLRQNPEWRHEGAVGAIVSSLRNAFPCRSGTSR
jgi:hypothetical protein